MVTGVLTIGLVIGMFLYEERQWLRRLSYLALGLVLAQGLLGGLRVLLVSTGLANLHGVLAQLFVCSLVAMAVGASGWWRRLPKDLSGENKREWDVSRAWGLALVALIFLQLIVGSIMRHRGAGMAIPYFPHSTASGDWLPAAWNWAVAIHFAHRVGALLITVVFAVMAWRVWSSKSATRAMKVLMGLATGLLVLQVLLGASIIWSIRQPLQTTLHVLNGVLLLSAVWSVVFAYFRPVLEQPLQRQSVREPMAARSEVCLAEHA
jgi:cytochrome c oxidase assembly protein subunit 15